MLSFVPGNVVQVQTAYGPQVCRNIETSLTLADRARRGVEMCDGVDPRLADRADPRVGVAFSAEDVPMVPESQYLCAGRSRRR